LLDSLLQEECQYFLVGQPVKTLKSLKMYSVIAFLLVATVAAQNGFEDQFADQGDGSYIHNPLWDLTPFQKYQLKKGLIKIEGLSVAPAEPTAPAAPAVQAAPVPQAAAEPAVRRFKVRRPAATQAAAGDHRVFANFAPNSRQAAPLRQAAPIRPAFEDAVRHAAPRRQAAAPVQRFQAVPQRQAAVQPTFQSAPQAPLSVADIAAATGNPDSAHSRRFWQYTADKYAAKAEGSSYTYSAIF